MKEIFIKNATEDDIKELNKMLTDLIQDERKYDENINKTFIQKNSF